MSFQYIASHHNLHVYVVTITTERGTNKYESLKILNNNVLETHYENLPMQYMDIFSPVKIEHLIRKFLIFFLFLLKT